MELYINKKDKRLRCISIMINKLGKTNYVTHVHEHTDDMYAFYFMTH